ncbi:MAG: element excision factor XisH family protein [Leptolyngbyaceae cyanobacterium bins.349]|nr:element excision factor XisH family protein [Leptolyngbyaceae cyanobacterium bins.349]
MSARDAFHDVVRTALQRDGWTITHDPYPLQAGSFDLAIDLGAEKVIAAQQGDKKIAVEIKSFLGPSKITEFYAAMGHIYCLSDGFADTGRRSYPLPGSSP